MEEKRRERSRRWVKSGVWWLVFVVGWFAGQLGGLAAPCRLHAVSCHGRGRMMGGAGGRCVRGGWLPPVGMRAYEHALRLPACLLSAAAANGRKPPARPASSEQRLQARCCDHALAAGAPPSAPPPLQETTPNIDIILYVRRARRATASVANNFPQHQRPPFGSEHSPPHNNHA